MKKIGLAILCLCILFFSTHSSSETSLDELTKLGKELESIKTWKMKGYEWAKLTLGEKIYFVEGLLYGCYAGLSAVDSAIFQIEIFGTSSGKETGLRDRDKYHEMTENALRENGLELDGLTTGQIIETINIMYSDPRVKQWEVKRIMPMVRGRLKGGWTERDVDEVVSYYIKREQRVNSFGEGNRKRSEKGASDKFDKDIDDLISVEKGKPRVLRDLEAYKGNPLLTK